MSFLSKVFKNKDGSSSKNRNGFQSEPEPAPKPKWEEAWTRTTVEPEEVQELLHVCTEELKSRALDMPFVILPFRPETDASGAKSFIRNFFKTVYGESTQYLGESLRKETKLNNPIVLCSIMKWCWSRLPGGVIGWNTYELFKEGEKKSNMARHAFDTFLPLSTGSEARTRIIFDFFDLLVAISANGKANGLGGRKLSRLAGWWAFEHNDHGRGFEGGYTSWARSADACSHLYFAYLRSRAPEGAAALGGISGLPRSLQALVSQTEYPPEPPSLLESSAPKVIMIVDRVSPTPYALLRRAKNFDYHDDDEALQQFSGYDDPVRALTFECRRVINAISHANSSQVHQPAPENVSSPTDSSWSRFEDVGFGSFLSEQQNNVDARAGAVSPPLGSPTGLRSTPSTGHNDLGRPTTPSWADFMSSGFADDANNRGPASLLLPPSQILPPLGGRDIHSSQSHVRSEEDLEPGELASVIRIELDETFWWVWMSSLAPEEPNSRKAVFGRCAFIETEMATSRWFVIEEQVKGASEPEVGAIIVEKKSRFTWSRRGRSRRESTGKAALQTAPKKLQAESPLGNKPIAAEQKAKVDAAAAALVKEQQKQQQEKYVGQRRGRMGDDGVESKTTSVMTLQPVIMNEAGPAMQWARKFDKEAVRAKYLGDSNAGRGSYYDTSTTMTSLTSANGVAGGPSEKASQRDAAPAAAAAAAANAAVSQSQQEQPPKTPVQPASATQPSAISSPIAPVTPAKDTVSTSDLNHVHRKQLSQEQRNNVKNSTDTPGTPETIKTATTQQSPAAVAAAAAFNQKPAEAEPDASAGLQKRKGSTRALKNLFNRKKEEPEALAAHRRMVENRSKLSPVSEQSKNLDRRPSKLWRKPAPSNDKSSSAAAATGEAVPPLPSDAQSSANLSPVQTRRADHPNSLDLEGGEPGPMLGGESRAESRVDTRGMDSHEIIRGATEPSRSANDPYQTAAPQSTSNFSNFSSGPAEETAVHDALEQQPRASDVSTPEFNTQTAARMHSEGLIQSDTPVSTAIPEQVAEQTSADVEPPHVPTEEADAAYSSDRWAQIRKNAVDRQESVDQDHPSRQSVARTERSDEGETSGEETIDARVARIKARVAELTANQGRL